jgi:hypothetical protein
MLDLNMRINKIIQVKKNKRILCGTDSGQVFEIKVQNLVLEKLISYHKDANPSKLVKKNP